jgi:hypothetical protein
MHSSAAPSAAIFESDKGQDHPPPALEPLGAFGGRVSWISDVRFRQVAVGVIFSLYCAFVMWLVDGDPTHGETARVSELIEQQRRGDSSSSPEDNGWCSEAVELRQQWRAMQRIAGFAFRERVDLCSPTAPARLFSAAAIPQRAASMTGHRRSAAAAAGNTVLDTAGSGSLWSGVPKFLRTVPLVDRADESASLPPLICGVSRVSAGPRELSGHAEAAASGANVSWMVLPSFLTHLSRTANGTRAEAFAARQRLLHACAASDAAMMGQLPPQAALRNAAKLSDLTLLHHAMSDAEEKALWADTRAAMKTAASLDVGRGGGGAESFDRLLDKTLAKRGTPALHNAALAAQFLAIHSCATPSAVLANVVRTPPPHGADAAKSTTGGGALDQNEFASWRLWEGGPLVMAAVCRSPPFDVVLEVSPSSSWVELL